MALPEVGQIYTNKAGVVFRRVTEVNEARYEVTYQERHGTVGRFRTTLYLEDTASFNRWRKSTQNMTPREIEVGVTYRGEDGPEERKVVERWGTRVTYHARKGPKGGWGKAHHVADTQFAHWARKVIRRGTVKRKPEDPQRSTGMKAYSIRPNIIYVGEPVAPGVPKGRDGRYRKVVYITPGMGDRGQISYRIVSDTGEVLPDTFEMTRREFADWAQQSIKGRSTVFNAVKPHELAEAQLVTNVTSSGTPVYGAEVRRITEISLQPTGQFITYEVLWNATMPHRKGMTNTIKVDSMSTWAKEIIDEERYKEITGHFFSAAMPPKPSPEPEPETAEKPEVVVPELLDEEPEPPQGTHHPFRTTEDIPWTPPPRLGRRARLRRRIKRVLLWIAERVSDA